MFAKKLATVAAIIFLSSGCTTAPPAPAQLLLPPPLELPTVEADELQCLSVDVYERLAGRDELQRQRIQTLEEIIKSTWP